MARSYSSYATPRVPCDASVKCHFRRKVVSNAYQTVRERSLDAARRLGYPVNPSLPAVSDLLEPRAAKEIVDRALVLALVIYGVIGEFPTSLLREWAKRENLVPSMTERERRYFDGVLPSASEVTDLQDQIEALWTLSWVLGKTPILDFSEEVGDSLAKVLPDVEHGEDARRFRADVWIRPMTEILEACDLSYCLHWAIVSEALHGRPPPGTLEPWVVVNRRRALEWTLSRADWDDVPLDT